MDIASIACEHCSCAFEKQKSYQKFCRKKCRSDHRYQLKRDEIKAACLERGLSEEGKAKRRAREKALPSSVKAERSMRYRRGMVPRHKRLAYKQTMSLKQSVKRHSSRLASIKMKRLDHGRLDKHKAWEDWLKNLATDEWLNRYYSSVKKPWHDHRLSDAKRTRVKRKLCPEYATHERLRATMRKQSKDGNVAECMRRAIKANGGSNKVESICGYTIKELVEHLERQFTKGMTWEVFNTGAIHIDHIIPKSTFDVSDAHELEACWALTNLQPLWADDNRRKSNKIDYLV